MNALSVTIDEVSPVAREVFMLFLLMTECAMAYTFIRLLRNRSGWRPFLLTVILFMPPYLLYQGMVFFEYTYPEFRRSYADMMKRFAGSVPVAAAYVWLALCACFIGWTVFSGRAASRGKRAGEERRLREAEQETVPEQMQTYSQAVSQMVRHREVLHAKQQIHADMGRVLLMTRRYLVESTQHDAALGADAPAPDGNGADGQLLERTALIDEWREVVRFLRTGTHEEALPDVKKQLLDAADAAGVALTFRKEPPAREDALRDYVKDASAKIVEAVHEGRETVEL